ncbi:hypothetical protein [Cohnella zeiphila]|uniref:Uncharacterized protein n=1 Tax=Cohnella zeiphila TaxID=2761120 RepID=A0A7X0SPS3_9BACL|nr:hypothetical protein [Cohnella zeiphila]MBB6733846.1 hypothetical protein [Cohnella zeiphila]
MPSKSIATKIAAITLALSAVASPLAANAASGPLADRYAAGQSAASSTAVSIAPAIRLADPLELAKQYAPDTVPEWEKALAAFNSLTKSAAVLTISESAEGLKSGTFQTVAAVKLSPADIKPGSATLKAVPIGQAQALKAGIVSQGEIKALKLSASQAAVPGTAATLTKADAVGLPAGQTAVTTAAAAQPGPLFQARIDLGKTAESKDAEAIRQSLAKLLKLYQAEIEELQDGK